MFDLVTSKYRRRPVLRHKHPLMC